MKRKIYSIKNNNRAISAVIGVMLMVAIAVAVAAVTYAYMSGLIGVPEDETPVITFQTDDVNDQITVLSADVNLHWDDVEMEVDGGVQPHGMGAATIDAGDYIDGSSLFSGDNTVSLRWIPTNTLLGSYDFTA